MAKIKKKQTTRREILQQISLECHLRALELSNASVVTARGRSSTATTATASTGTSTTTTAATATSASVAGTRRAVVQTHRAAVQVSAVQVVVGLASLVDGGVLHVTETLRTARLGVGWQTDAHDTAAGAEHLVDGVLIGAEGEVAHEQRVALGAGLVTERAGTSLHAVLVTLLVVGWATTGVVEVDLAAVDLGVLLGCHGLGRVDSVGELDISESVNALVPCQMDLL